LSRFNPGDLTPDFAITNKSTKRGENEYVTKGSFICDVKKFPNPFAIPDAKEGDFRGFDRSLEQLKRYGAQLRLAAGQSTELIFGQHDIVLLTKSELADVVYRYLLDSNIPRPFNLGRPLVLVEYYYDAADQNERYVFKWKQGDHNSPFSHPLLRKDMVDRAQPMKVPPKIFIPSKYKHVLCNDAPPAIYLLVFLWLEIFPELLTKEQYEALQDKNGRATFAIRTSPYDVMTFLRSRYNIPVRISAIRDCFRLLVRTRKAYTIPGSVNNEHEMLFSSLSARPRSRFDQEGLEKRMETREYGVIFAKMIAQADEPIAVKVSRRRKYDPSGQGVLF
jgi:hypothetical protein